MSRLQQPQPYIVTQSFMNEGTYNANYSTILSPYIQDRVLKKAALFCRLYGIAKS